MFRSFSILCGCNGYCINHWIIIDKLLLENGANTNEINECLDLYCKDYEKLNKYDPNNPY